MHQFVKNEDMLKAYMRWHEGMPPLLRGDSDWAQFLGLPEGCNTLPPSSRHLNVAWEVPDIGAERIKMINNSPHWRTMLKVMAIKEAEAMPWVSEQDYIIARKRWEKHWPCHDTCSWVEYAYGGIPKESATYNGTHWLVPEDAARKIELLAGPHFLTVLKIFEIKHREALNKKYLKK